MSTLKSQYKKFLKLNINSNLSFEQWEKINGRLIKQALINMKKNNNNVDIVMKNLIIIAHPNKNSFCYNGIFKTIKKTLLDNNEKVKIIDLYSDDFSRPRTNLVQEYKETITWSDRIYIISPVWWFRLTPRMEIFFDEVFTPGFAYKFVPLTKLYGYPKPLLSDKKVRTYLTHGAPSLPVKILYLNSVKLRLVMGVYSFVFGWFKTKTRQFWSVPFISDKKRHEYLLKVKKDIEKDLR